MHDICEVSTETISRTSEEIVLCVDLLTPRPMHCANYPARQSTHWRQKTPCIDHWWAPWTLKHSIIWTWSHRRDLAFVFERDQADLVPLDLGLHAREGRRCAAIISTLAIRCISTVQALSTVFLYRTSYLLIIPRIWFVDIVPDAFPNVIDWIGLESCSGEIYLLTPVLHSG